MFNRHMKRKLRALGLAAAMLTMTATIAAAAITTDAVIAAYQAEGYTRIEVKVGPTQIKVEAIKGDVMVETIYDIETGDVLQTESQAVDADQDVAPGVSVRDEDHDFIDANDDNDDGDNPVGDDNHDDDHGDNGDDNSDDDHGNDDHGDDGDVGDDHADDHGDDHGDDGDTGDDDEGGDNGAGNGSEGGDDCN